jgi:ABC-type glycerol-3-phosphate transport system substrate-binding protein
MKKSFLMPLAFLLCLIMFSSAIQAQELRMWVRTPETLDILRKSASSFMEENPGIEINIVEFPADDYPGALQAAINGNNLPDIFHTHNSVPLSRLDELNLVQPLDPYFSDSFVNRFDPATWLDGSTTLDGKIFAWPDRNFRRASLFMYYNKNVMEAAGLDPNSPPTNWDELKEMGQQVRDETGQYGLHLGFTSSWFIERVILQLATTVNTVTGVPSEHFEGTFIDWTEGNMFDYENVIPVIELFEELDEKEILHPNYLTAGRSEATAHWAAGQSAFLIDGSWRLQEIILDYSQNYDLDFGISMLPGKKLDTAYWGVQGGSPNSFVVAKSSENAEIAAEFFEFLTDDYYPELIKNAIDLTPVPAINENENYIVYEEFNDLIKLTNQGTKVLPSPQVENPDELLTISRLATKSSKEPLGPAIQGYLSGEERDIEEYLKNYSEQQQLFLEEALKESKEEGGEEVSIENWIYKDWDKSKDYVH